MSTISFVGKYTLRHKKSFSNSASTLSIFDMESTVGGDVATPELTLECEMTVAVEALLRSLSSNKPESSAASTCID